MLLQQLAGLVGVAHPLALVVLQPVSHRSAAFQSVGRHRSPDLITFCCFWRSEAGGLSVSARDPTDKSNPSMYVLWAALATLPSLCNRRADNNTWVRRGEDMPPRQWPARAWPRGLPDEPSPSEVPASPKGSSPRSVGTPEASQIERRTSRGIQRLSWEPWVACASSRRR